MAMEAPENLVSSVLTPLLISGSGIVITAVAILIYHFVIVRFCLAEGQRSVVFDSDSVHQKQSNQGLDKKILNKIPPVHYISSTGQPSCGVEQAECAIYLVEFEEKVVVRVLPRCRHAFHVQCVDEWLSFHSNCPVCRSLVCPIVISSEVAFCLEDRRDDPDDHSDRETADGDQQPPFDLPLVRADRADQEKPARVVLGLKRSFSMDQSHVLVDMLQRKSDIFQRKSDDKISDPSSSSLNSNHMQSKSYKAQFDRTSTMLMMSLSQLWMGTDTNGTSNMANGSDSNDAR